eukprot:4189199-Ditylum_brightwellii.AAC.1
MEVEVFAHSHIVEDVDGDDDDDDDCNYMTPLKMVLRHGKDVSKIANQAAKNKIQELETQLDELDLENEDDNAKVEHICEEISNLEEEMNNDNDDSDKAKEALTFFGIPSSCHNTNTTSLSGGFLKKVMLSCALFAQPDILMLDEPTNHLDISGIVQLRRLISSCSSSATTVLLVSHDVDLINDIATDVIHLHNQTLEYYNGCNYNAFLDVKSQQMTHQLKQGHKLEKQRNAMIGTIDKLKQQAAASDNSIAKKKIQR